MHYSYNPFNHVTFIFCYKYLPIFHEDSSTYQTNSHQQEYAENDFQIEKKSLFTHFRCYCQDDTFMEKFY